MSGLIILDTTVSILIAKTLVLDDEITIFTSFRFGVCDLLFGA